MMMAHMVYFLNEHLYTSMYAHRIITSALISRKQLTEHIILFFILALNAFSGKHYTQNIKGGSMVH